MAVRVESHTKETMTNFASLGLAKPLLSALAAEGYVTPTPIDRKSVV